MKLYHGTSDCYLSDILTNGLKPRDPTSPGNFPTIPSDPSSVYLTNAWALWYAIVATNPIINNLLMVEIDMDKLDEEVLRPDEDYLRQVRSISQTHKIPLHVSWSTNIHEMKTAWHLSLHALGIVAYAAPIPPEAITRICVIDPKECRYLCGICFYIRQNKQTYWKFTELYANITRYCFDGEALDLNLIRSAKGMIQSKMPEAARDFEAFLVGLVSESASGIQTIPVW